MKRMENGKVLEVSLFVIAISLTLIGIISVYSAGSYYASIVRQDPFYYVQRQTLFALISVILCVITMKFKYKYFKDYRLLRRSAALIIAILIGLLVFGTATKGAKAWILIGPFSFQPSEFAKLLLIWATAFYFAESRYMPELPVSSGAGFWGKLWSRHHPEVSLATLYGIIILAVLLQPDTGGAAIMIATIGMLWLGSGLFPWKKATKWLFSIIAGGYAMVYLLAFMGGSDYRIRRIIVFLNPFAASVDDSRQIRNSFYALARGGFMGVGLGNSVQKTGYLPEFHTDFILSIIGEELGLFGVTIVVGLLITLIILILRRSKTVQRPMDKYILMGIALMFAVQIFLNVAGVTSLAPLTGVTLPFISYGGSSMLMSFIAIGIVLKISLHDKKRLKESLEESQEKEAVSEETKEEEGV